MAPSDATEFEFTSCQNADTTGLNTPHAMHMLSLEMMATPHTSVFTTLRASSTCFSGLNCNGKSHQSVPAKTEQSSLLPTALYMS